MTGGTPSGAGEDTRRREAWARYWGRGALHSCVGSYGDAYGGRLGAFWREVFAGLDAPCRVLDVATGNGVLARMLLGQRREPAITCDAVDLATVRFPWLHELAPADRRRLRVRGGVDAAALPFAGGAFDLAMSHYGVEYSDLGRSVPELVRVLAPGGGVAMVLHHAAGRPALLARREVGHLDWLGQPGGLLDATAAMVEPMARAATPEGRARLESDPAAHAARARFNALQDALGARARAATDGADLLLEVREAAMAVLARAGQEGAGRAALHLAALREELAAAGTRLRDLLEHALEPAAAQALRERLAEALGAEVDLRELAEEGGHLMGWALRSVRPR